MDDSDPTDKLLATLLATLSYELRTPTTNIIGFVELVQHPAVGELNDKQREYLHDAVASARTVLAIADDLQQLIAMRGQPRVH